MLGISITKLAVAASFACGCFYKFIYGEKDVNLSKFFDGRQKCFQHNKMRYCSPAPANRNCALLMIASCRFAFASGARQFDQMFWVTSSREDFPGKTDASQIKHTCRRS